MARNTVIVQFKVVGPPPSLAEAANALGVLVSEMDAAYGVVPIDPSAALYSVVVDDAAATRVEAALNAQPRDPAEGVYSNPPIQPFEPRI